MKTFALILIFTFLLACLLCFYDWKMSQTKEGQKHVENIIKSLTTGTANYQLDVNFGFNLNVQEDK